MKTKLVLFVMILFISPSFGQRSVIDSFSHVLSKINNDTMRLVLSNRLSWQWLNVNSDSSIKYAEQYMQFSKRMKYSINEADALHLIAFNDIWLANYPKALETLFKALKISKLITKDKKILPSAYLYILKVPANLHSYNTYKLYTEGNIHNIFGILYWINGRGEAHVHFQKVAEIANSIGSDFLLANSYLWKGVYTHDKPDSSLYYLSKARDLFIKSDASFYVGPCTEQIGVAYHIKGDHKSELKYLQLALQYNLICNNIRNSGHSYLRLSEYFSEDQIIDSIILYAYKALSVGVKGNYPDIALEANEILANIYKSINQRDSSYKYLESWVALKNKSLNSETARQFENVQMNQEIQERELLVAQERYQNRIRLFGLVAGLSVLLIVTTVLLWNNKQKKKANTFLQNKNEEIETQKNIVEKTLSELKTTQSQLIQSEKMASLGELTAGIAHEIQNPLNFVNNFSEVNSELIDELEQEVEKGNLNEVKALAKDIKENEQKINHHGKRADAIVKGMLQHSRSSSGVKEPTDINSLADEYLRLAYHGLRAKDKSFNATLKTDFDESIGKINIIPQDIGRVILNLITNAFYAVDEKKKLQAEGYEPTVSVSTSRSLSSGEGRGEVLVSVKDNGPGIPQKVLDKIFQPFFTTKPTGQGTGLGLSLAYDIVKAHGGELKVETKEGEGTEFSIQLPINTNNV
jgi:two-component system, NtrC family, sensor kinase